jgi:flotillin
LKFQKITNKSQTSEKERKSMKNFKWSLFFLVFIGIAFIVGAFRLTDGGLPLAIWSGVGLLFILLASMGFVFSSLYVKARGNLAYLKTGKGGAKVIKDGGMIIVGFLHEIIPVSLETMKIVVKREGKQALITLDQLRAEVTAEFYIRVKADDTGIGTAARTLGDKISAQAGGLRGRDIPRGDLLEAQTAAVTGLEQEKLVDALRTVAARKSLYDLNFDRESFKKQLIEVVKNGLEENGLELEDVTISSLDQASANHLDPQNTFDAIGLKNLRQIVSEAAIAENQFKRTAELEINKQNVLTEQTILQQNQELAFKTADQGREVRTYQAQQEKMAAVAEIQTAEDVAKRGINKEQVIELETVGKDQAIAVASKKKEEAEQTAAVAKDQAIELAERAKQIAIAKAEKEKADAEAARALADQEREKATQGVKTVEVVAAAEREKEQTVIAQKAVSEKEKIAKEIAADAAAYAKVKEATATKESAVLNAEATVTEAKAGKEAAVLNAEGQKATSLIPVEVTNREVEVEKKRVVEVTIPELEARSANAKIAFELEVRKLEIEAKQAIGVALATAMGEALGSANLNVYGGPDTVARIMQSFMAGQEMGKYAEGVMVTTPEEVKDTVRDLVGSVSGGLKGLAEMGAAAIKSATGKDIDPDALLKAINKVVADPKAAAKVAEAAPEEA